MLNAHPIGDIWRVSSWSKSGNCVEIGTAGTADGIAVVVQDTKNRSGEMLSFHPTVWKQFVEQAKRTH
jgi:hypothetical protein